MIAGVNQQELKAHNAANVNTPGFKEVFTTLQEFQQTDIVPSTPNSENVSRQPIGHLGLGVMTTDPLTKFTDGALQATNQPLDFAIQGDGFFRIMTSDGERYTRDGRFTRNLNGNLVAVDGNLVLGSSGNPIQVPDGDLTVDSRGAVFSNNILTAQLGIAEFEQPELKLQRESGNLFKAQGDPVNIVSNTTVHQGFLEMSNVNVVALMISTKTYEANHKMVQTQDELLGKSISILGKLS